MLSKKSKKQDKLPPWKQEQRRIVRVCLDLTGREGGYLWKIPRSGLRIPDQALFAMTNHGGR
jgi:hypothetical protein